MNLSPNFTLEELVASDYALRHGIDNTPSPEVIENLRLTAQLLERVRELLGAPIHVSSGFRCLELNAAIGSAPTSAHVDGRAADFVCPSFGTPKDVAKYIAESEIGFDQLIFEGTWCHIAIRDAPRRQVMTATFTNGKAVYTQGIA